MPDNEIERVRNMLAEGKITAGEAEQLIAVLDEVGGVERDLEAVGAAADRAGSVQLDEVGDEPEAEAPPASEQGSTSDEGDAGGWPGIDRWLLVSMLAGDLDVRLDESISEPVVRSPGGTGTDFDVVADGNNFRVSQFGNAKGDFFNRLIDGFKRSDLDIRLPPGFSLKLDMKAGDITMRDVPYLSGKLLAGDLDATGLQGIDLDMQAGDLDLELTPTAGRHKVRVSAGDVNVRLNQGSNVQVRGRVSIGEARIDGDTSSERSGLGASLDTTVGSGDATLDLQLSTGQLTLKVHDE